VASGARVDEARSLDGRELQVASHHVKLLQGEDHEVVGARDEHVAVAHPHLGAAVDDEVEEHHVVGSGHARARLRQAELRAHAPGRRELGVQVDRPLQAHRLENVRQGVHGPPGNKRGFPVNPAGSADRDTSIRNLPIHKQERTMSAVPSTLPSTASPNPNKALWEKGDFTRIASTMRESGESLVRSIGVNKGIKVLDLGGGDGTTALPAARLGAEVLVVDIARNLVAAGNKRASEAGLANIRFQEGDATDLQALKDQSFDLVVTIFGAMFAPKPFDVAKEMVRVTKPGGRIVMGNWIPNDPTLVAQILKISAAYTPPP